jgi:hypothetical protein
MEVRRRPFPEGGLEKDHRTHGRVLIWNIEDPKPRLEKKRVGA